MAYNFQSVDEPCIQQSWGDVFLFKAVKEIRWAVCVVPLCLYQFTVHAQFHDLHALVINQIINTGDQL